MFTAYEAIHITPENLLAIKDKLGSEYDRWDEAVMSYMYGKTDYYLIFNFVHVNFETGYYQDMAVPKDYVEEMCHVAHYNKTIDWITNKN